MKFAFSILVILFVIGKIQCDYVNHGPNRCGDNHCSCDGTRAVCDGSKSKLSYIPSLPKEIRSLEFFNNTLPMLSASRFQNISSLHLEKLYIDSDEVINVTEDAFVPFKALLRIRIKGNRKVNKSQLFVAMVNMDRSKLQVLDLTNNGISGEVPRALLDVLRGSFMDSLTLKDNYLTSVNIDGFRNISKFRYLSLSSNIITSFNASSGHPYLQALMLPDNELLRYPPQFCTSEANKFPNLHYLNLANNFISVITPSHFGCLANLTLLDLSANQLRHIPDNIIANLISLRVFRVGKMLSLRGRATTIDKYAFNSSSLRSLYLDSNSIIFNRDYVDNNIFEMCKQLTYLDIRQNNMVQISDEDLALLFSPLTNLESLYLDANTLRTVPKYMLRNFTKLTFLSVDGNSIRDFGESLLGPVNLKHLSASANNIRVIKPETFPKSVKKTLRKLNLSKNPFSCSCENLWFRNWIGEDGRPKGTKIKLQNWSFKYICYAPNAWNRKELKTYRPTEASCNMTRNIIILSSCLGSLSLIALVGFLIGLRYRWYVMFWFYRLKQRTKNRDPERRRLLSGAPVQPYTYVIYHDDDSDFVHHTLRTTLEEDLGFNLYIWHRDSVLVNGSKAHVMFDAIESSENVLAVISNNFVKDDWCEFQLEIGLTKKNTNRNDCLTLLLLEDLDFGLLRLSWCVTLVKTGTRIHIRCRVDFALTDCQQDCLQLKLNRMLFVSDRKVVTKIIE